VRFHHILFALALFTFSAAANNQFNIKTIVIDAGHGGKDPGAIGYGKSYEKDVALAVALKLGEYIQKNFPDVRVVYTRKTDVFLELHQRAEIANKAKADLFIAIHCNSSTNNDFYGTSSYILGLHRTEANLEVAKRENSVIMLEEDRDKNYEFNPNTPEGHIIMSMKQNAFLDQSIDFAAKVENQLETYAKRKSMGVKQAGFYVLYKTAMPSLLAEIGFISNPEEEKYLNSTRGQDQIASGLFNAFRDYKTEMEGGETDLPVVAEKKDNTPPPPVKKETPVVSKTPTTQAAVKEPVKETPPIVTPPAPKETVQPAKETAEVIVKPTPKDTVRVVPPVVKETVQTPPPVKETPVPVVEKTDIEYTTLSDGIKIKKPIDNGGGGGKATATIETAPVKVEVETPVVKETKPTPVEPTPKPVVVKQTAPVVTETKTVATENKTVAATPVKTEVKATPVVKETPQTTTTAPTVVSNRHPLVPVLKTESGVVLRIQLFALKGELKEYDKFVKLFKVMGAEELGNGITRYYGAKATSLAEARKYHQAAVSNGYKDSYIVGFKDGKRMNAEELKELEGK